MKLSSGIRARLCAASLRRVLTTASARVLFQLGCTLRSSLRVLCQGSTIFPIAARGQKIIALIGCRKPMLSTGLSLVGSTGAASMEGLKGKWTRGKANVLNAWQTPSLSIWIMSSCQASPLSSSKIKLKHCSSTAHHYHYYFLPKRLLPSMLPC